MAGSTHIQTVTLHDESVALYFAAHAIQIFQECEAHNRYRLNLVPRPRFICTS
ncbi:unnamed protein product [Amoebophrya sp. A120]|nr:unnamed protein product [Amoebophrya sp. A120]|eukprot:GSA120T00023968001.1